MARRLSRSDRALLASAWREVSGHASVRGRSSSAPFQARYAGFCGRCGRAVETGQMIQFHRGFDDVVHIGCHAPGVFVRTAEVVVSQQPGGGGDGSVVSRQPPLCDKCNLEHAGECW